MSAPAIEVASAPESTAGRKLRAAASSRNVTAEARELLGELAGALDSGVDVDPWAGVDLRAAFSPEMAIRSSATTAWLGRLLEVLVFVPIGITWLGLMEATQAYRQTLHVKSLASETFLQRWQLGFAGRLPGWLTFDNVALYTFSVIVLVVALAIAHLGFRARSERGAQASAYRTLSSALTVAEMALAPVRLGAVGRVAAALGTVSAMVAATTTEIKKVGESAERAQTAAAEGLVTMGETIEKVTVATAAVQAAAGEVGQAAIDMGEQLAAATAATGEVAAVEAEFADKLLAASEKLDATIDGLAERLTTAVASGQTQLSRAVAGSSERVADTLNEGADQVRRAIDGLKATTVENAGHVRAAVASLTGIREAAVGLPTALARLDAEVAHLTEGVAHLTTSIGNLKVPVSRPSRSSESGADYRLPREPRPAAPSHDPAPDADAVEPDKPDAGKPGTWFGRFGRLVRRRS